MNFESTFSSVYIGSMLVKNRLAVPAMDSGMAEMNGGIQDATVDYYAERAKGGFGMVIVEIAAVQPSGKGMPAEIDISSDEFIPGLTKLADGIKQYGSRAVIQLHHAGRETVSALAGRQPVAPSSVPCPVNREKPHELTTEEVYDLINDYIKAAIRAKIAGFDAIEIHAAHGYMGGQFLSPRSNKRIDEFGGSIEGRAYFLKLIVNGIKKECGVDFPVIVRISSNEQRIGGIEENEAIVQAQLLESYGYDALHISAGTYGSWDVIVPPPDTVVAWNIEATKRIKSAVNIPVIAVGRYNDVNVIDMAICRGDADLISLGRQSIADPEFPNKMFSGQIMDIIPCISCTQRCMSFNDPTTLQEGDWGVSCMLNPSSNARKDIQVTPASEIKKVVVVGAGPGGLEAAFIAAKRGHKVKLFEKNDKNRAGGQFLIASYPPFKQELTKSIKYLLHMCVKYGVEMNFGVEADSKLIESEKPDVLIVATGSTPIKPPIKGIDGSNVKMANDVLLGEMVEGDVLVVGGGLVGVEVAEYCTDYCDSVTIIEMLPEVAPDLYLTVRESMLRRFKKEGIIVHTNTKILELTETGAICQCGEETINLENFSSIILALGSKAYNPLQNADKFAKEVHVIGDAKEARSAVEAIYEGFRVAIRI